MFGLENIDTIVQVDATLSLERDGVGVIQHVEGNVGDAVVGTSNGEVIDLSLEENSFSFNKSRI